VTSWKGITWDTARAGGFAAYVLLTAAVAAGLILKNRWQSTRFPRLVTNELHGYLSLLALVFITVHVCAVLVDPFTRFGLAEVFVPFASHYRPIWMGLGIVALYLLLAVWVSSRLRARIGFRAWRAVHFLAYGVYGAATVHGLGTGSDTRSYWALLLYGSSILIVGGLAGRRLLVPTSQGQRAQPVVAALGAAAVVIVGLWTVVGPLAPHWGARAGGRPGSRAAAAAQAVGTPVSTPALSAGVVATPFRAAFDGRITVQPVDAAGRVTIRIDGALHGGTRDHLEIYLRGVPLQDGGVEMEQSRVRLGAATPVYQGEIVGLRGSRLVAAVRSTSEQLRLAISLDIAGGGLVSGVVRGTGTSA
jgi:DMSO/TMAO reductase YedYZ heme-binding membrane subunit